MKKSVLMFAPVLTRSGYGDHARDLAYSIIQYPEYDLEIYPTNWGNTPWNGLDESTEKGVAIRKCITRKPKQNPDIFMQLTIPNEFIRLGKFNIGVTAGIETDLCKPEWIEGCNNMDMVIGTSNHTINVLKNSVYDKHEESTNKLVDKLTLKSNLKLEVLFEGVDTKVYYKTNKIPEKINNKLNSIKEENCYLFVGHWLDGDIGQDRKDVGMLIRTFCEAFKNKPASTKPALVLKISSGGFSISDYHTIYEKIERLTSDISGCPSIHLVYGNLTEEEMNGLYNHRKIKAMVSFTKGEGFGRPFLEFTTTGKPLIVSNWSGHTDFLNPEMSILLPGELTPVHKSVVNKWFIKEANWFTVNYGYAIKMLQAVEKNYSHYAKMSENQKKHTEKNFTFDKMSKKLKDILDTIDSNSKEILLTLPKLKI
jgi:glycosyltransferase involved in cell wall biosynthesis